MSDLDQIPCDLKSGDEKFHSERGADSALRLLDYWRWAESCLMDNTTRGLLAEFLVAAAIGQQREPRKEWEAYDLETKSGVTIEVKSSAYIQSWKQTAPSQIQFGIAPRKKLVGCRKRSRWALGAGRRSTYSVSWRVPIRSTWTTGSSMYSVAKCSIENVQGKARLV